MALTDLQKRIMRRLSLNRSPSSYLAGGLILNLNWPRRSDDIDIFHDTDEEVSDVAKKDIADLEKDGLQVTVDVRAYGTYEATVSDNSSSTVIQWMSDTRIRFFPLVRDEQWGASTPPGGPRGQQSPGGLEPKESARFCRHRRDLRQHVSDRTARDGCGRKATGIFSAEDHRTDPLARAVHIRRRVFRGKGPSCRLDATVHSGPSDETDRPGGNLHHACAVEIVGVLSVDADGTPIEVTGETIKAAVLRKATEEPDVMPMPAEFGTSPWSGQ